MFGSNLLFDNKDSEEENENEDEISVGLISPVAGGAHRLKGDSDDDLTEKNEYAGDCEGDDSLEGAHVPDW